MSFDILFELGPITVAIALGITIVAGVVKGAIGFAMPLIIVSVLSSFIDPKLAIAAIILPIVASNILQTFRQGIAPALAASKEHWRYLLVVCIMIFVTAQLVPIIPRNLFYYVLGVPVVILSFIQLVGLQLTIADRHKWWAEWLIAAISGALGGLAGTWGPTTVLYLLAMKTEKLKQITVQGVIYGLGSITLLVAHIQSGILNARTIGLSAILVPFALFGMWFGFKLLDRLNPVRFRQATLLVLTLAGLNLLRKGLVG
ncbi:sulfite exporter TauE/SafE family protein [Maritalea porphyrae]|jgi:uncharacterized membrane protein YfcA|uniref:sulfite exporter TauE/SafE family protein n=1 Tax=Maritalea porphyrae TaxID=880732 RepID=UPI0022B04A13|nr:sulfite exporter TauE/SafE family protein [Maritalea porphyrae]MCZ4272392.1 sulfite exporter TauE/SafE family protein [Maritalea porphyrae]